MVILRRQIVLRAPLPEAMASNVLHFGSHGVKRAPQAGQWKRWSITLRRTPSRGRCRRRNWPPACSNRELQRECPYGRGSDPYRGRWATRHDAWRHPRHFGHSNARLKGALAKKPAIAHVPVRRGFERARRRQLGMALSEHFVAPRVGERGCLGKRCLCSGAGPERRFEPTPEHRVPCVHSVGSKCPKQRLGNRFTTIDFS